MSKNKNNNYTPKEATVAQTPVVEPEVNEVSTQEEVKEVAETTEVTPEVVAEEEPVVEPVEDKNVEILEKVKEEIQQMAETTTYSFDEEVVEEKPAPDIKRESFSKYLCIKDNGRFTNEELVEYLKGKGFSAMFVEGKGVVVAALEDETTEEDIRPFVKAILAKGFKTEIR